jgi:hypothetical protein
MHLAVSTFKAHNNNEALPLAHVRGWPQTSRRQPAYLSGATKHLRLECVGSDSVRARQHLPQPSASAPLAHPVQRAPGLPAGLRACLSRPCLWCPDISVLKSDGRAWQPWKLSMTVLACISCPFAMHGRSKRTLATCIACECSHHAATACDDLMVTLAAAAATSGGSHSRWGPCTRVPACLQPPLGTCPSRPAGMTPASVPWPPGRALRLVQVRPLQA